MTPTFVPDAVACRTVRFRSYAESVPEVLEAVGAPGVLARQELVLIKPNLVGASPPPVTFPAEAARALVEAVRRWSSARIVVAEGTGDAERTTHEVFRIHGYDRLARDLGVELVDLNEAPLVRLTHPGCRVFPEFWMPRIVTEAFVVSAAVLKAHSLAGVTLTMKNMMGVAPPRHYQQGGYWKKSAFHARMHEAVFELNRYRKPDLAFIDATRGLAEYHLGGPECDPPPGRLVAGFDPVAVDAAGCRLLGKDWRAIGHIRMAHGVLGEAPGPTGEGFSP